MGGWGGKQEPWRMQRMDRSPGTLNLGSWIGCGSGDKIGGGIMFTHSSSPGIVIFPQ